MAAIRVPAKTVIQNIRKWALISRESKNEVAVVTASNRRMSPLKSPLPLTVVASPKSKPASSSLTSQLH